MIRIIDERPNAQKYKFDELGIGDTYISDNNHELHLKVGNNLCVKLSDGKLLEVRTPFCSYYTKVECEIRIKICTE